MPSSSEPSLSECNFVPDSSVVGCTFSWPNSDSDSELEPDNSTSELSVPSPSEPSQSELDCVPDSSVVVIVNALPDNIPPAMCPCNDVGGSGLSAIMVKERYLVPSRS